MASLLPGSLIAAIFTLSLIGRMPIYVPPLLYIGGTLWYGLFNWFWLLKEQPMRESLSLIYHELANYCDAKYTLLTDPEKALPPLLARQQKVVDPITTCYQHMHMLSASRDHSHKRLTRAFQVALDLQEHISVSLHQLPVHSSVLRLVDDWLHGDCGLLAAITVAEWRAVPAAATIMDTLMGCLIVFGRMLWLWPQWQSGLLRQNAHDALETYQDALLLGASRWKSSPISGCGLSGTQCAV